MKPKPQRANAGLQVRYEARRYKIELFPLDPPAAAFVIHLSGDFGVSLPNNIHKDARTLHVHPAYNFMEVVEFFQSYNDDIPQDGVAKGHVKAGEEWTPSNRLGKRIVIAGRVGTITEVFPPETDDEVERILVVFDDDLTASIFQVTDVIHGDEHD